MPTFIPKKMSNGRWCILQEGEAAPALTKNPGFAMGLSEDRARELAQQASVRRALQGLGHGQRLGV